MTSIVRTLQTVMALSVGSYITQLYAVEAKTTASAAKMAAASKRSAIAMMGAGAAVIGLGAAIADVASKAERATTLAALAGGADNLGTNFKATTEQVMALSAELRLAPDKAANMLQTVRQMGVATTQWQNALVRASYQLSVVTERNGEAVISQEEAAQTIYRLAVTTGGSIAQSEQYASAIAAVGRQSVAGTDGLVAFIQKLDLLGVSSNSSAAEIIAFSNAMSDMNKSQLRLPFQSMTTLMATFQKNGPSIARSMHMTNAEFNALRESDPIALTMALAKSFKALDASARGDLLLNLGFNKQQINIIDAAVVGIDKFNAAMEVAGGQIAVADPHLTELQKSFDDLKDTLSGVSGAFEDMVTSAERAAVRLGGVLVPALKAASEAGAGIFDAFGSLTAGKILGGGVLGIGLARRGNSPLIGSMNRGFTRLSEMALFRGRQIDDSKKIAEEASANEQRVRLLRINNKLLQVEQYERKNAIDDLVGGDADLTATATKMQLRKRAAAFAKTGQRIRMNEADIERLTPTAAEAKTVGIFGKLMSFLSDNALTRAASATIGAPSKLAAFGLERIGATAAIPYVGEIIAVVSLLEPVFSRLGDFFQKMANQGGVVGALFEVLAVSFKTIAAVGHLANMFFDGLIEAIKVILKFTGLGFVLDKLGDMVTAVGQTVVGGENAFLATNVPAGFGLGGASSSTTGPTVNVNTYVTGDSGSSAKATSQQIAMKAVAGMG